MRITPRHKIVIALLASVLAGTSAAAEAIWFANGTDVGGATPPFLNGDLVQDDTTSGSLTDHTIYFSESNFTLDESIDAAHGIGGGSVYLSTSGGATLGGITFADEDVVLWDAVSSTATLVFDGSTVFSQNEDVDAFSVLANGNFVLSTVGASVIAGNTYDNDDLIEYDPATGIASLYFDPDTIFALDEQVDAVHVRPTGQIILSTGNSAAIGALSFTNGQVVEYDPGTGVATLLYDAELLPGGQNVRAVFLPEPESALLLTSGIGGLAWAGRRPDQRRRADA
jgi:hypothetical protein